MFDKIKLLIAVAMIAAGIAGFYYYSGEYALLYRVLALLLVIGLSFVVALQTEVGMNAWNFGRSAAMEMRKVVWPTRRETMQTTLIVILMVSLIGVVLWLFDMGLLWSVKQLTGQGS